MKFPEKYRVATPPIAGIDGAFQIPYEDKFLSVLVSDHSGWEHASVSLKNRCPTWAEMCFVKGLFWEEYETVVQFHPAKNVYVNVHPFCLHLWKPKSGSILTPPSSII